MEITKKQWAIIGVVIAVIAIWYFFLRKKKPAESGYGISGANIGAEHCCDPHCNTRSVGGKCLGVTAKAGTAGANIRGGGGGVSNKPTCPYGRCATWTLLGGWFCGPCATAAGSTTTTTQA